MRGVRTFCLMGVILAAGAARVATGQAGTDREVDHGVPQADSGPSTRGAERDEAYALLRNGNVLAGQVRQLEDGYVVVREGATVHLEAYQVVKVGQSVSELYDFQRKSLPIGKAVPHLKLAEWCLQHGLLDEAGREIAAADRLDPDHPRLEFVKRRLAVATESATSSSRTPASKEPVDHAAAVAAGTTPVSPIAMPQVMERKLALRELPDDTMEQFRRRVQPLLLNSCTASGCHRGNGDETFVLDRRALWRDAPHTLTVQNLAETLKYVDEVSPLESPLLRAAGSLHSSELTRPPVLPQSTSYAILEAWLLHITAGDRDDEVPNQGEQSEPAAEPHESTQAAINPSDAELDAILSDFLKEEQRGSIIERKIQRGVRPTRKGWDDPFDPEEFNRRYSPRGRGR